MSRVRKITKFISQDSQIDNWIRHISNTKQEYQSLELWRLINNLHDFLPFSLLIRRYVVLWLVVFDLCIRVKRLGNTGKALRQHRNLTISWVRNRNQSQSQCYLVTDSQSLSQWVSQSVRLEIEPFIISMLSLALANIVNIDIFMI